MNDERLIVTGLELPITDVKELRRIAQTCYTEGRKDGAIDELEKIKVEIREWYWQADKQKLSEDACVVDAMTDLFIRTINEHISELKGENK